MGNALKSPLRVAVVGGINMDIGGRPNRPPILHDSNPGAVRMRPGGVGRNIAHNLLLLGAEVSLIAPLGDDMFGRSLLEHCRTLGLDMSCSPVLSGEQSSSYLYICDERGEMALAIADMEITAKLTPEKLEPHLDALSRMDALVLDANLEEETLLYLAEKVRIPLCADPVSTVKAMRLRPILPRLRLIKPNRLEAEALTGEADPEKAAASLLAQGVERVFVSMGPDGILAAESGRILHLPCLPMPVVNTNGAGDAATAALIWAGLHGMDLLQSTQAALMAGALTAACTETNPLTLADLPAKMGF